MRSPMMTLAGMVLAMAAGRPAAAAAPPAPAAEPAAEQRDFQAFFRQRFPTVPLDSFADGPYAVDAAMRRQWQEIMQMPPYEFAVDEGKRLFETKFTDGGSYADCLPGGGVGTRQDYPYFDTKRAVVVTLPVAINECRQRHGEAPLDVEAGPMASITAYLASTSRGKKTAVVVPDDPRARAALEAGRALFSDPHGPSGLSCAGCHVQGAGARPDGGTIAPALGILASFPIYRSGWGGMGTAARRIRSCDASMGGGKLPADAEPYREIEYYLSYMSDGVAVAGPGARP
jgi:sulfur-oxidizing protein SoxA